MSTVVVDTGPALNIHIAQDGVPDLLIDAPPGALPGLDQPTVVIELPPPVELAVATPGQQGPPGPPGPAGGSYFVYDRSGVPAATWTIQHDLGRPVHVTVTGDDGREVDSDVEHPGPDTTVITFAAPFSGRAIIG